MAVNYPLYTALALEPILNDPSNLAGGEERRAKEREKKENDETRLPALRQEAPKIHGGHEDRETTSANDGRGRERTGSKTKRRRGINQEDLSENHLIFQRSCHVAPETLSSFCLEDSKFTRE